MNNLQNFIDAADAARKEKSMYGTSITVVENLGEVICYRCYAIYKKGRPVDTRTNFKLNRKVISAANLSNLLK